MLPKQGVQSVSHNGYFPVTQIPRRRSRFFIVIVVAAVVAACLLIEGCVCLNSSYVTSQFHTFFMFVIVT